MRYLLRLDDVSENMDVLKWRRMETILDQYGIKPIFGIIPHNEDPELLRYDCVEDFWQWMQAWLDKGWVPALHGYSHTFETSEGGINPINNRSEFAGVSLERQREKISNGYSILKSHGIEPKIFFAPAHTFDENTLVALEKQTAIRVISDTIASDVYYDAPFYFVPQQSGHVRKLPFSIVTFCYHPNTMISEDFEKRENFLKGNAKRFCRFSAAILKKRRKNLLDELLSTMYFMRR